MGTEEGPIHTSDLSLEAAELRTELEQGWRGLRELKVELKKLESEYRIHDQSSGEDATSVPVTQAVHQANQSWRRRRQRSLFLQTARRRLRR